MLFRIIKRKSSFLPLLLFIFNCSPAGAIKWLLDNPNFDSVDAWSSGYLPCGRDEIIFPADYRAVLPLPKEVEMSGFVLPSEGAILLNQDMTISFGDEQKKRSCENDNNKAYIKKPQTRKWFDPTSWRTTADMSRNAAVTHMERVPCNNESVIIQRNGPLSIDLEYVPFLRLGQLSLAGSIISKDYLRNLLHTDIGQILFRNSFDVTVEYYRDDVCGCHKDFKDFIEPICHTVSDHCERPHCLTPISPLESCCNICGAMLSFALDSCDDGNLLKLLKVISLAITDQGLSSDLDFHVAYVSSNLLQAVIVDREAYSEKSVAFVQRLNSSTDWAKVFARPYQIALHYSGRPYNGGVTFGSILLIMFCVLFVAYVALVIVSHYAPDNHYVRMVPPWVLEPRRWTDFFVRSPFVFARFQNSGGNQAEENIDNLAMRFDTQRGAVRERAFDNPMFDESSKRKEENKPKTEKPKSDPANLVPSDDEVAGTSHVEEQELTEIKLETSSDSSDEDETKE